MNWRKLFKSIAKGVIVAVSLGLIGGGRKTKAAAKLADDIIDEVLPDKEKKSGT